MRLDSPISGLLVALLLAVTVFVSACGGDGDGPRSSPTVPITPTATVPNSAPSAPCAGPTIVLQNGTTVVVSGSPGSSVPAGNVTINFSQTCTFTTTTGTTAGAKHRE